MILTCPECASSYFVEDSAVGSGRMVRCASCNASWRAEPPPPLELKAQAEEAAPSGALAGAPAAAPAADDQELFEAPVAKADSGAEAEASAPHPAEELPKAFRAKAETERRTREAAVQGVIWAGMGASFALLIGLGVVFRSDVVRVWPKTASAYASVGLTVNPIGLAIEDVHFQHALEDGHPALVVSGTLHNIRPRAVSAPPLQITLLDKEGKALLTRTASSGDAELTPGQSRSFNVSLLDPPMFASDLEVGFAAAAVGTAPRLRSRQAGQTPAEGAGEQPAPALPRAMTVGPPIPDAKPLPPTSPYALKPGAGGG